MLRPLNALAAAVLVGCASFTTTIASAAAPMVKTQAPGY